MLSCEVSSTVPYVVAVCLLSFVMTSLLVGVLDDVEKSLKALVYDCFVTPPVSSFVIVPFLAHP